MLVKYKLKTIVAILLAIILSLCFITLLIAQTESEKSDNSNVPKQELKITVRNDDGKSIYEVGETIVLNLTVKNNDDVELFVLQSCATVDYKLTVKDEYGLAVSLTKEGLRRTNRSEIFCSYKKVKIESGKSKQDSINLSQLYDMSAKGKYYVSASRSARKGESEVIKLESNIIEIIIE